MDTTTYRYEELRKLPVGLLSGVIDILETNYDWKRVMSIIPKDPASEQFEPKYNNEHIRLIEEYSKVSNKKCTEILIDEWSTSGRIRPTLTTLKQIVQKAQIFRAADEIASILQEAPPTRPNNGPAATIKTDISILLNDESIEQKLNAMDSIKFSLNSSQTDLQDRMLGNKTTVQMNSETIQIPVITIEGQNIESKIRQDFNAVMAKANNATFEQSETVEAFDTQEESQQLSKYQTSFPNIPLGNFSSNGIDNFILQDQNLISFEYSTLQQITNNFSNTLVNGPNGPVGKIGSGGFGEVFSGYHPEYGMLAVKKAFKQACKSDQAIESFNTEVKYLSQFRHKNIVPILGYSIESEPCIVCEYIVGGSLYEKIAEKILNETQRIHIMLGTAEGLRYLHKSEKPIQSDNSITSSQSTKKTNFVHRDVKSANILLTSDFTPKLCDFGLARQFESTCMTTKPMGTSAYMAPEGHSGTITQKNDIFSYGIVLLELLTGLKPIVYIEESNEQLNIKDYIEENIANDDIARFLDPVVEKWMKGQEIYYLAKNCLAQHKSNRPSIEEICDILYRIYID